MNRDFRDLLAAFSAEGVEFLVVGAHALAAYGYVRATKDFDLWVRPDSANAVRTYRALADFGAALDELQVEDLARPGLVFQIGVPPVRIDIVTEIDGVDFAGAWARRSMASFAGLPVPVLARADLIANKRASGRLQDLADLEELAKLGPPSED